MPRPANHDRILESMRRICHVGLCTDGKKKALLLNADLLERNGMRLRYGRAPSSTAETDSRSG